MLSHIFPNGYFGIHGFRDALGIVPFVLTMFTGPAAISGAWLARSIAESKKDSATFFLGVLVTVMTNAGAGIVVALFASPLHTNWLEVITGFTVLDATFLFCLPFVFGGFSALMFQFVLYMACAKKALQPTAQPPSRPGGG